MVTRTSGSALLDLAWRAEVGKASGQAVQICYQCQKCAAGCLSLSYADYTPNQVLRMVALGLRDRVLKSKAIWLCSGCLSCTTRCPNGIDIARVMDTLRQMAAQNGASKGNPVHRFHTMFVNNIRGRGRVNETFLLGRYELVTGRVWRELGRGLALFRKGKMPLFAHAVRRMDEVQRIFARAQRRGGGSG
ncbi:MAG: 4Fe-4S dicluster domain-containing protein [Desulfotomaculales bacterium]